uniref:Uncharacterized protein n=1 Tax=Rhizophora mucronata TaxID=61149 RepID=A0A2P2QPU5_RHIMU
MIEVKAFPRIGNLASHHNIIWLCPVSLQYFYCSRFLHNRIEF